MDIAMECLIFDICGSSRKSCIRRWFSPGQSAVTTKCGRARMKWRFAIWMGEIWERRERGEIDIDSDSDIEREVGDWIGSDRSGLNGREWGNVGRSGNWEIGRWKNE
jgi:hypothetical protein